MAIKFETVTTSPPAKPAAKSAAVKPQPAAEPEAGKAGGREKAPARKLKSRNNLKKK